jgi:MFS family permease
VISDVPLEPAAKPEPQPAPVPGGTPRLLSRQFAVVIASGFAYFVAIGAMLPIVPRYVEDELGGGGFQVGIGVGAFAVSAALLRPWIGRMGDLHGRRVLVVAGATTAGLSIMAYSLATSLPLLVLARLATGAGEAGLFIGLVTATQDLAPDHRRGEATSYFSVSLYGGLAVGPPVGEALLHATSFRTTFLAFGCWGLLAAVIGTRVPRGETVDAVADGPVLQPAAIGPGIILLLGLIPTTAFGAFLPLYAEKTGFGDVGPVLGLEAGLVLVVRIFGARLPDALGWRRASALALGGVAFGVGIIGVWASPVAVWSGAVALAFGMSLLFPALFTAVIDSAPESERSRATGTFTLFFDLATGFGAALVGAVVSLTNHRLGFVFAGCLALTGLVAQYALRDRIARPAAAAT